MGWASIALPTGRKRTQRRRSARVIGHVAGLVQGLEQLGEAAVPVGERVGRGTPISTISKMPGMIGSSR